MDLYREEQLVEDYFTFLRFRSISADPEYAEEMQECADWVAKYLEESGLEVEQWPTPGYPVVPALYLLVTLMMIWSGFQQWPWQSAISLGSIVAGVPIYFVWTRLHRA